jgi:hypothetical protein
MSEKLNDWNTAKRKVEPLKPPLESNTAYSVPRSTRVLPLMVGTDTDQCAAMWGIESDRGL